MESQSLLIQGQEEEKPKSTYSALVGYGIGINFVIGTGVFSLPYAFYSAGLGLSIITLVVSGFFSFLCVNWVLESLARAEGVTAQQETPANQSLAPPVHKITYRKFDFTTLFNLFVGLKAKLFCQFTISVYCYGVLWAYGAVFASSVSSLFFQFVFNEPCDLYHNPSSGCTITYYLCILCFAVIVVPLSCRDMEEQAVVQMFMTAYRFSAFGVMLLTIVVAMFYPNPFPDLPNHSQFFDFSGFATVFTSVAVATNFHYNVPDIIKPVRNKNVLTRMVSASLVTALSFYVLIGILCALFFRAETEPLVTLNWKGYTGLGGGWAGQVKDRPWWAAAIQLWVMLFPVFDMLSIYPLVAITLGNNILETLPEAVKDKFSRPWLLKLLTRLLASVPSLIFAVALGKLDSIFTFTGLFAFFLQLIFPCILQLLSIRYCSFRWNKGSEKTPYSSIISAPFFSYATLLFGFAGVTFAVVEFILSYVK